MNSIENQPIVLKVADLRPGDILLHRSIKQKIHQKIISAKTSSPYTHASIFLGDDEFAEAIPFKVKISSLSKALEKDAYIGVLRSQCGFGNVRVKQLRAFILLLIKNKGKYDFTVITQFKKNNTAHFQNYLDIIANNYGQTTSLDDLAKKNYFCSALIVACYTVAGIVDESAQAAYPTDVFSPADLCRDDTFGWFLGYLLSTGQQVTEDDPLNYITHWKDII